jgi:hypothetical protein
VGGRIQDQSEILTHETDRELRRVVVLFCACEFSGMGGSDNGCLSQGIEQKIARQVQPQTQRDCFCDRLHAHSQKRVHH